MKKVKIIAVVLILVCTSIIAPYSVDAHEMFSGMRWCHMSKNAKGLPRCDILINYSYVDHTNWVKYIQGAIDNWNLYADGKVVIARTTYQAATVTLHDYGNDDSDV